MQKVEGRLAARLPKVQAREAKVKAEGKTARADRLDAVVTKIQNRESKINARLAKAEATCRTTGSSGTTATHAELEASLAATGRARGESAVAAVEVIPGGGRRSPSAPHTFLTSLLQS